MNCKVFDLKIFNVCVPENLTKVNSGQVKMVNSTL